MPFYNVRGSQGAWDTCDYRQSAKQYPANILMLQGIERGLLCEISRESFRKIRELLKF